LAELSRILRPIISIVLLGATVLGLLNVFGDTTEVDVMSSSAACKAQTACTTRVLRLSRTPIAQSYGYSVREEGREPYESEVTCKRQWILAGDYSCSRTSPP
jgi:hypothetical protein